MVVLSVELATVLEKKDIEMIKLYNLIQKRRGKEVIMMTDSFTKVRQRKSELEKSQKGGVGRTLDRVSYSIKESVDEVKYKKKPTGWYQ